MRKGFLPNQGNVIDYYISFNEMNKKQQNKYLSVKLILYRSALDTEDIKISNISFLGRIFRVGPKLNGFMCKIYELFMKIFENKNER